LVCFAFAQYPLRQLGQSLQWVDAVEKGFSMPPARNYRISGADVLNRSCAFRAGLESILLGGPSQNHFSTASVKSGRDAL
jgi:hypothetical protein